MKKLLFASAVLVLLGACSSSSTTHETENVGATAAALSKNVTDTPLSSLSGFYTTCLGHADGDRWSARIAGSTPMPSAPVTIRKHDVACVLSLDLVTSNDATYTEFDLSAQYPLSGAYGAQMSFVKAPTNQVAIVANAKLSATGYDSDFVIEFIYSDDSTITDVTVGSHFSVISASATADRVPAPLYALDATTIDVNEDATNHIDTIAGSAVLTATGQIGEDWSIFLGGYPINTWGDINDVYAAGNQGTPIPGSIPADVLLPPGSTLPYTTVLILRHTDMTAGVWSFQTFTITATP